MKNVFCAVFLLAAMALNGIELRIVTEDGEAFVEELSPETSLGDIEVFAESLMGQSGTSLEIVVQKGQTPRNYYQEVTDKEKKEMAFIVKTLAFKPLAKIYKEKNDLQKSGDKIDHVHPLRFLMTICTDEELLVGLRAIRKRGWVWSDFAQGFKDSFKEEASRGNLTTAQLNHFASVIKVDAGVLSGAFNGHQWEQFIDLLIEHVKRNDDSGRYDM